MDCKLGRNRNCLTHFWVSHWPQASHCGLSGNICGINAGPLTKPQPLLCIPFLLFIPDPRRESAKRQSQHTKTEDRKQTLPHSPHITPNKAGSSHLEGVPPSHITMAHLDTDLESVIIQERRNLWSRGPPAPQDQSESQEGLISRRYAMQ